MKEYYIVIVIILAWIIFSLFARSKQNQGYKCPNCHSEFQPSSWLDYLGPHLINLRYIKCPNCQKRGWAEVIRK